MTSQREQELEDAGRDWQRDHIEFTISDAQGAASDMAESPDETDLIYEGMLSEQKLLGLEPRPVRSFEVLTHSPSQSFHSVVG